MCFPLIEIVLIIVFFNQSVMMANNFITMSFRLPLLKLTLTFFCFKECNDIRQHSINDSFQHMFWDSGLSFTIAQNAN